MKLHLYTEDGELGLELHCCCILSGVQALASHLDSDIPLPGQPALPTAKLRACKSLIAAQSWVQDNLDGGKLKASS